MPVVLIIVNPVSSVADSKDQSAWAQRLRNTLARSRNVLGALLASKTMNVSYFDEIEEALIRADCGVAAAGILVAQLRERARRERITDPVALRAALKTLVADWLVPLEGALDVARARPLVLMVAGVNGSGKTTSIGKLAKWLRGRGLSVLLAAGDTFRAAARDQLAIWAERNGVAVVSQREGDPGAVIFDAISAARARSIDAVIADTAGRLPTQLHLMEEIKKVKRVIGKALPGAPHEVLLVLDASTGQNALAQFRAFDEALGLTGLVLTKLDGTAKGGIVCAIAQARPGRPPLPLYFLGVGEAIDDFQPFVARDFADALLD